MSVQLQEILSMFKFIIKQLISLITKLCQKQITLNYTGNYVHTWQMQCTDADISTVSYVNLSQATHIINKDM